MVEYRIDRRGGDATYRGGWAPRDDRGHSATAAVTARRVTAARTTTGEPPAGPAAATRTPGPLPFRSAARPPGRSIRAAAVVLAPMALMLALGLWGVRHQGSMGRDESTTYQMAHRDLAEIWQVLGNIDAVHGLYYLLMHAVYAVWDGGLAALRLPSVLAMTAAAGAVALIGRRLAGPGVGLAAGLVFPLIPTTQQFAQEGRSYALVCATVAWSTYLLLRAVDRRDKRAWAGYAAVAVVACLLHEFAVLAVVAHGVTLSLARVPGAVRRAWAVAAGCVLVPLVPLVVISEHQSDAVSWIKPAEPFEMVRLAVLTVVAAGCAAAPGPARRGPVRLWTVALPLLVLPSTLLMLSAVVHPLYAHRYVVYSYLGLALALGAGVDWLARTARRRGRPAVVCACAVAVAVLAALLPTWSQLRGPQGHLDDPAGAARVVRELAAPGDGVLFMPADRRESLLSHPDHYRGLNDLALDQTPTASGTLHGIELTAARLPARMLSADRIVVLRDVRYRSTDDTAEGRAKRAVLAAHYEECASGRAHGITVIVYARPGRCAERESGA
ncbi:glycosyltransferase family 39 protein [Streptomyces sp. SAJ15]|uniref:glycosyltransferase family 39 protein n=1 Tax=Streptomyces sp. SAJ15 TaxID=2011095 RepID=UPI0021B3AF79|nr:glycosyltransferase family 39 protein [Streptomyces sp. SAJ15]